MKKLIVMSMMVFLVGCSTLPEPHHDTGPKGYNMDPPTIDPPAPGLGGSPGKPETSPKPDKFG